jgi:pyruvate dehydrogenase E2 component (dihydrolipoamide acetyltransferase)
MSTVEVRVPDMGNFDSVSVIDVLVKPGDSIDIDTPLATLETDKATDGHPVDRQGRGREGARHQGRQGGRRRAGRHGEVRRRCAGPPAAPAAAAPAAPPRRAARPPPRREGSSIEVRVPDMGSFDSVSVIESW